MSADVDLTASEITQLLPYVPPYRMIDRVAVGDDRHHFIGVKNVSVTEAFFAGHFPAHPVLPGVLQLEAMFQLAVIGATQSSMVPAGLPMLAGVEKVKFRQPVVPGDRLLVEVRLEAGPDGDVLVRGTVRRGAETSCDGTLRIAFLPDPKAALRRSKCGDGDLTAVASSTDEAMDIQSIERTIPHRFPFLLLDRILSRTAHDDGHGQMVGLKNVTFNDAGSLSVFAGEPYLTAALQVEIMAQVGCVHMRLQPGLKDTLVYFMSIDRARFVKPVVPGDQLIAKVETALMRQRFGKATGRMFVGDDLVAEAEFKFALGKDL